MGQLNIAGRVQYMPGPWGADVPAAGAQVEVFDIDVDGTDRIWSGSTAADGRFAGTSSEWQDRRTVPVWQPLPLPGRFVNKQVPDPADLLLLKARVRVDGREHVVQPFLNGTPVPVLLPWGPLVERSQRALVVVNNTVAGGRPELRDLYRFIEAAGDAVAHALCGPVYADVRSINGSDATLAAVVAVLRSLAARPELRAVDLILNMHGADGTLFFHGTSGVAVDLVRQQLQAVGGLSAKLRLLYNTSCFGATHAAAMRQAGFDTAIGGVGVVANSVTEYPAFLAAWAAGSPAGPAMELANAPPLREPMDRYATEQLHFPGVDSRKQVSGRADLTIHHRPI
jgi:hypothetical protein